MDRFVNSLVVKHTIKIKSLLILLCLMAVLSFVSCRYDKKDEIYGDNSCDTTLVKFEDIRLQFEQDCFGCHLPNNGTGIVLHDYESLKSFADSNSTLLLGVTDHTFGSPMPKGGNKWESCRVEKLKAWINQGMKKQ